MMVATSAVDVAPVMLKPLMAPVFDALVPVVRAGVTVTTMELKLELATFAAVLVHVMTVEVEVEQSQSAPPLIPDCVNPVGSVSVMVTVAPAVEPGPLLPAL